MKPHIVRGLVTASAILLIAGGTWWAYPPAGLIVAGALLWWDMNFGNDSKPTRLL